MLTLRYRPIENQQLGFTHGSWGRRSFPRPSPVCEEGGERREREEKELERKKK
jgi:hypothetical protein